MFNSGRQKEKVSRTYKGHDGYALLPHILARKNGEQTWITREKDKLPLPESRSE